MNKDVKRGKISRIKSEGSIIEENKKIADHFNDYFVNIGHNLAEKIPPSNCSFVDFLDDRISDSIFFNPVLEIEVLDLVGKLASKKSTGHDGLSNFCLKSIIPGIVKPLTYIFNLSIVNGIVPQKNETGKSSPNI